MEYNVKLDAFEGPLDLLLHLVNRLEIDIYDISLTQITDQYLDFIHTMQRLQLDVAGDYLLMAATLLEMKSKMLLPLRVDPEDQESIEYEEEDPREELIRRLVEYRQYKKIAEDFKEREARSQLVFSRPPTLLEEGRGIRNHDVSLYEMISSLQKLVKRKRLQVPRKTRIRHEETSIQDRMEEIMVELESHDGRRELTALYGHTDREYIVTTFLAVLELMKKRRIVCRQAHNFTEIKLYRTEAEELIHATQGHH